jgi:hypothetical protein
MAQLSRTPPEFDRFLFAPLNEDGETPLSVLSALARQDIDAWQEAARLAQLPKDHAVNSLASTIWKSDSKRWSPSAASIAAVRLIELLPSHVGSRDSSITDNSSSKMTMWLVYGIIIWSVAVSGSITRQANKEASPPHTNIAAGQQEEASTSSPILGPSKD